MTLILFAVIMYYKYYGVIVTYLALEQVNQVTAVRNSVFSLMDPYYLADLHRHYHYGCYVVSPQEGAELEERKLPKGKQTTCRCFVQHFDRSLLV